MSKGTVTLLVIVFVVCISCGAGYAAYRIVREKLRRLSRMAFGTDSITEGLEQQAKELAVTPKSVSAMTRIFLPQIQRDFPDFHIEQFKDKVENALMLALQAISAADAGIFERQIKDGVSEEFLAQIKNRIRENETEAVTEHYEQIQIHQTEIANYEKKQGTCMITFQSAVGYLHYCEKAGKVLSGSKRADGNRPDIMYSLCIFRMKNLQEWTMQSELPARTAVRRSQISAQLTVSTVVRR